VTHLPAIERKRLSGELIWEATGAKFDDARFPLQQIEAHVTALTGYSAHADQKGLVDWAFSEHRGELYAAGKTIFVQHGEDRARHALANALKERAIQHGISEPLQLGARTGCLQARCWQASVRLPS
jgi:metallo-beta-lactamase family protein